LGLGRIPKNPAGHAVHRTDQPVVHRLKGFLVATRYVDKQVIEVPLSPPIRSRGLEPGRVRIARVHTTPSKQTPDRMGADIAEFLNISIAAVSDLRQSVVVTTQSR